MSGIRDNLSLGETAIAQQQRRASRAREASQETMLRDIALVDTQGSAVGQINGLSVLSLGGTMFGRPNRITCRVRPGGGRIIACLKEHQAEASAECQTALARPAKPAGGAKPAAGGQKGPPQACQAEPWRIEPARMLSGSWMIRCWLLNR